MLALLNIAMMDASIACWEAKYTYWLLRPSQADTSIRTVISVPNFPSYPSGHAAFSGAASEVLARLFPDDSARVRALADEAAQSRVFAGLHYPFDSTAGLIQGREIAQLVLTQFQVRYPLVDQLR
ncbi:MAG TPA: vanadium-dependent haloperoxidase [Longimicrobium sp.]